jgi:ketosteroid isomerase-like protein
MKTRIALLAMVMCCTPFPAMAEEPNHEIHEELRAVLRQVVGAINSGNYDNMLPVLDETIAATSVTQEVMSSRADVSAYFREWFGPGGYMKTLDMKLEPDALTELSPDKSWGLVRGKALEHYEAKDGDQFDFRTRWTAVLVKNADNRWRLRAIHFGTNHLDNPVLTKVQRKLTQYGIAGGIVSLLVGIVAGWFLGRRRKTA